MVIELISVGTEILLGNIINTNAAFLAEQCAAMGLSLYYQTVVGDNPNRLEESIHTALKRADILILTGGLGPTQDDLTKEIAAKASGKELYEDSHTRERIMDFFKKGKMDRITENNWKQAMVPEDSIVIDNENGTAPGIIIEMKKEKKRIILLPGPPDEMVPMFYKDIYPYLNQLQPEIIYSKTVKICGLGESFVETEIQDMIEKQTNPTIAPYAKTGEVHLRVTAKAKDEAEARQMIEPLVQELEKRFGSCIYTTKEEETLEEVTVLLLKERGYSITTVESCTGGLFAAKLVNVAGVSDVLKQGVITYSNEAKQELLHVSADTLKKHGAVSENTAEEMARGGLEVAKADVCVSITGIAGPEGGTKDKPVGLVYVACNVKGTITVKEYRLSGNRQKVRDYAVVRAMILLRECILQEG